MWRYHVKYRVAGLIPDPLADGLLAMPANPMDLGSERIMSRQLENYGINILQLHAEWLLANGYKREATSCKQQIRMILINKKKKEKRQAASFKLDKLQAVRY